tara:strand:- start:8902 stop:9027 length:126 start_codon:yes stop_codon:yes gene_type:complete
MTSLQSLHHRQGDVFFMVDRHRTGVLGLDNMLIFIKNKKIL